MHVVVKNIPGRIIKEIIVSNLVLVMSNVVAIKLLITLIYINDNNVCTLKKNMKFICLDQSTVYVVVFLL
jgi:hypothetical protein